ncbi:MAG: PHD finger and BAH domain (Snt2) [Lasallia pustulata]|uniref:PHD finger and BAH domain (Snt2) n=1 Tax=Lasallia pustulata TaxID=136370 RepID=A0A5M8Q583_9LECA|nr:MAG: PHD finger and BAH domain (Snt2) [Lasallia pustulata]
MADDSDNDNDSTSPGRITPQPAEHSAAITPPATTNDAPSDSVPPRASSGSPRPPVTVVAAAEASTKATPLDSQPMTATSSNSSAPSIKVTSAGEGNGPSPYGTRSRNRTGTARINYAEDRDMDVDVEWGSSSKKGQPSSNSAAPGSAQVGESEKFLGVSTRRSSTSTNGSVAPKSAVQAAPVPKDYIPGMSTFSVNADTSAVSQAPSKKRKAPGGVPTATTSSAAQTHTATTRRTTTAIPTSAGSRETNMLTFESSQGFLKNGKLRADDGTLLGLNDHVYLICEPPGEPYYVARVMEFLHAKNDHRLPIDSLRVNWYYRPRDIQRKVNDTRVVFASMHSDTCPLTSLRGKCTILHRSDISDLDEYRKTKDSFWYEKMYDRYIHRYYEVIPTDQVINVPERVKKVLDERWKFVIVEIGRGKELTSAVKSCKRCSGYCASNDSVDCAMCKNTYHMNCVRPPLLKKPARGFAWSCGPCSRKQERKLEARNTPNVGERAVDAEEEELMEEEEDDNAGVSDLTSGSSPREAYSQDLGTRPATAEQMAQAKLWPYRYLGIHCRVEDALDYDDRIYPRASSRLGPRHQANVTIWHGRPVELVKPADIKKKYIKGSSHKKDAKLSKETIAALEADKVAREKRPKWVMDEPPGYVHRGEDQPLIDPANTARLQFRLPEVGEISSRGMDDEQTPDDSDLKLEQGEKFIDDYMARARPIAKLFGLKEWSTNFLDKALELLCLNNYAVEPALEQLRVMDKRKDLKEPELTKEEVRKFEEGVAKYGSELRDVSRHVGKSQKHASIVRFYYMWKKTDRGKQIWGHYEGRKGKKQAKQTDSKLVDDVADDIDDSAFDNDKAALRRRGFECKFCAARKSPQWRRAPGTLPGTTVSAEPGSKNSKDKGVHLLVALCQRCAGLWRKYGIQWENIDEVAKKVAQGGGRAWKRRVDEELLIELVSANEANQIGMSSAAAAAAASVGLDVPPALTIQPGQENAKKKQKMNVEQQQVPNGVSVDPPKKKVIEKPPEPPLIPDRPRLKSLPCAVCYEMEPAGDQLLCCRGCRLTVHRNCYGIAESRPANKWQCDMCFNDITVSLSTSYECVLCPVTGRWNEHELMEPPRISHKKKTDREREKERLEREMVLDETETYRQKQNESGKAVVPREPLKRTAGNNWVHVVCAVWTAEMIFGDARALSPSEGIGSIPIWKYQQICKLCKTTSGACVTCHQCPATFHVACAQQNGYILGFDVRPVKGSRRDVNNTIELGNEAGNARAVIYCNEHTPKDIVHPMNEPVATQAYNALQLYVRTYKQADTSMSGTVRKASHLINTSARAITQSASSTSASGALLSNGLSGANSASGASTRSSRMSPAAVTVKSEEVDEDGDRVVHLSAATSAEPSDKQCTSCGTTTSPKWHKTKAKPARRAMSHRPDKAMLSPSISSQPHLVQPNGYVNGDIPHERERSSDQPLGSQSDSVVEGYAQGNGGSLGHEASVRNAAHAVFTTSNGGPPAPAVDAPLVYQCHKCHLKQLRDPPSHRTTPSPPQELRAEPDIVHVSDSPSSSHAWPPAPAASVAPAAPSQISYNGWPSQPPPSQPPGPLRMPNGLSHSPPPSIVAPPVQHHYAAAPPPPQYHVNGYGHPPPAHAFQPHQQVGGGPIPYQLQRNTPGLHGPASYPSPRQQQYGSGQHAPYAPQPPNASDSPHMHHQASYGQHGPARAADNPFTGSYHTQTSPRSSYARVHGSPQGLRERPETPTEGISRPAGWSGNEGQMVNGASASPSLRNLLS